MQDPNAKKLPQPKDCLDDFSQEAQQKYNFFLTLFKLVRSKKNCVSNDPRIVKEIYRSNDRDQQQEFKFKWPQSTQEGSRLIDEFFTEEQFIKRIEMHREHFSKSKTKKEGSLEHYYVEIKPKER